MEEQAEDQISWLLYKAWRAVKDLRPGDATEFPAEIVEALSVARAVISGCKSSLRARYHALVNRPVDADPRWFEISWDQWQRQLELVPLGERALAVRDVEGARGYFRELERMGRAAGAHPVVLIDALIGLGDVERTVDNTEAAEKLYSEAEELARNHGLEFGRVRALVPWLFLLRRTRSAEELLPVVDLCQQIAMRIDDEMYRANAELARAEILSVAGDLAASVAAADRAAELFGDHPVALPGLFVRLADAFRMAEDHVGMRRAVLRALAALRKVDQPDEKSAALDLLATGRMEAQQWDSARVAARGAVAVAEEHGDGRSAAYAYMTLSQIERKAGRLDVALAAREAATEYFTGRDDSQSSLSYCLIESAELRNELGHRGEAARDVRGALNALESLRCQQGRPSAQQEYRRRFAQVYRRGLQAACRMDDPVLFVSVFEGLWGRRLAGLTSGEGPVFEGDAVLKTHLLAQAKLAGTTTVEEGRGRALRLLGRTALRGALPGMIEDQTDAAIAALATPYDHVLALGHLEAIPKGTAALLLAPVPERPLRYFALVVDADGMATCDEFAIPEEVRGILDRWRSSPALGSVADLKPLTTLLPEQIDQIPEGTPLLIVPLEEFWPLPWTAIPTGDGTALGARHPVKLSPSLALAAVTRERGLAEPREAVRWIGPEVQAHRLDGVAAEACAGAGEALRHLLDGKAQQDVIVVAHGVPIDGVGHFLYLDDGVPLSPLQAMKARPPGRVALISCWGSVVPGDQQGDPLTVATILQARGAVSVLATSDELSDDLIAAHFVDSLLTHEEADDWSAALHETIRATIDYPEFYERLRRWAPLRVLGAW